MMTFIAILAVLGTIIGIARYNEDDNLFWKLFIAFMGGIAAGVVANNFVNDKNNDKVVMLDKAPTQVLESMPYLPGSVTDMSLTVTKGEKSPKPVSKDELIKYNNLTVGKVTAFIRGRPQRCILFDTS